MQLRRQNAESGRNIKKMHPFLLSCQMGKRVIFCGVANVVVLDPEFIIPNHKMSPGKERCDFWLISGRFFQYFTGL